MKQHPGIVVVCIALFLAACGESKPPAAPAGKAPAAAVPAKAAGEKLALKADGKDLTMDMKSGVMRVGEQKDSDPKRSHAIYMFVLANYDLTTNSSELMKTLTNSADARVAFKLLGPAASGKDTPLAPGAYSTEGSWPKFDNDQYSITTVADGKAAVAMSQNFPANATKGEVKITSVAGDNVKGEINITTADKIAIKGNFTAKIKPLDY
jgi:hypothetical protein